MANQKIQFFYAKTKIDEIIREGTVIIKQPLESKTDS